MQKIQVLPKTIRSVYNAAATHTCKEDMNGSGYHFVAPLLCRMNRTNVRTSSDVSKHPETVSTWKNISSLRYTFLAAFRWHVCSDVCVSQSAALRHDASASMLIGLS